MTISQQDAGNAYYLYLSDRAFITVRSGQRIGITGTKKTIQDTLSKVRIRRDTDLAADMLEPLRKIHIASVYTEDAFPDHYTVGDFLKMTEHRECCDAFIWFQTHAGKMHKTEIETLRDIYKKVNDFTNSMGGYSESRERKFILHNLGLGQLDMQIRYSSLNMKIKKAVRLANVLLARPDICILDNPFEYLDAPERAWLKHFLEESKKTCVLLTHRQVLLQEYCTHVYSLNQSAARLQQKNKINRMDYTEKKTNITRVHKIYKLKFCSPHAVRRQYTDSLYNGIVLDPRTNSYMSMYIAEGLSGHRT